MTLKERRELLNLTQNEMASVLGIHPATWAKWENRKRKRLLLQYEIEYPPWLDSLLTKYEAKVTPHPDIRTNV